MKKLLGLFAGTMIALLISSMGAMAQEAYPIELQPSLNELIAFGFGFTGLIIAGLATIFLDKNKPLLDKLNIDDKHRQYLNDAIHFAVQYAQNKVLSKAATLENPTVKNQLVAVAVNYVVNRVPDALDHFGIDENSLAEMVLSRIRPEVVNPDAVPSNPVQ